MRDLLNVAILNWLYFIISVAGMVWAVRKIVSKSVAASSKQKSYYEKYRDMKLKKISRVVSYVWRKHYRLSIFIVTVVISWFVLYSDNVFTIENIPAKDELTALVLLATAAVVFWYTRETFDLKNITQKQKDIQQKEFDFENKPYLRLQWSRSGDEVLQIVNVGKGLAVDVCFEALNLKKPDLLFAPLRRPVLAPHQPSTISTLELQEAAGKAETNEYAEYTFNVKEHLNTLINAGKFKDLHVTYLDLREQVYDAIFTPDVRYNDRFNIKSQGKRES